MRTFIVAVAVFLVGSTTAGASHPERYEMERIQLLAHELEEAAAHLYYEARAARHHYDHGESYALKRLRKLESRARHFHRQVEKSYSNPYQPRTTTRSCARPTSRPAMLYRRCMPWATCVETSRGWVTSWSRWTGTTGTRSISGTIGLIAATRSTESGLRRCGSSCCGIARTRSARSFGGGPHGARLDAFGAVCGQRGVVVNSTAFKRGHECS